MQTLVGYKVKHVRSPSVRRHAETIFSFTDYWVSVVVRPSLTFELTVFLKEFLYCMRPIISQSCFWKISIRVCSPRRNRCSRRICLFFSAWKRWPCCKVEMARNNTFRMPWYSFWRLGSWRLHQWKHWTVHPFNYYLVGGYKHRFLYLPNVQNSRTTM